MNIKICRNCGRIVYGSERCCGELMTVEEHLALVEQKHPHAFEDYSNGNYERVSAEEIETYLRNWRNKYNVP